MFYNLKGIFDNWLCQGHERDEKLQKVLDQLNPSCKHCKDLLVSETIYGDL